MSCKSRVFQDQGAQAVGQTAVAVGTGQASPASLPPHTIRGGNMTTDEISAELDRQMEDREGFKVQAGCPSTVGVHWLQGSIDGSKFDEVTRYLTELFQAPYEPQRYGRWRYDRGRMWREFGVAIYYDSCQEGAKKKHNGRFTVVIPGGALDHLGGRAHRGVFQALVLRYGLRGSRLDIRFDDRDRVIAPWELVPVAERGEFTRYRRWVHLSPRIKGGGREGDQINFGSRGQNGNGICLRVYDKLLESGPEYNCVRWEVELKDERAAEVAYRLALCADSGEWARKCAEFVGGSIDFREMTGRASDVHLDRRERLPWWGRLLGILGQANIAAPARIRTVERTVAWVEKSVVGALAMMVLAYGSEQTWSFLDDRVACAGERLRPSQRAMVDLFHAAGEWDPLVQEVPF